ncbi:cytochrome P450 [Martensiomyces pterosporus]|nr:cytochrome P450 [Martensiomyces pterosporus]
MTGMMGIAARRDYERYGDVYMYKPNAVSISSHADIRAVFGSPAFKKSSYYKQMDILETENTYTARNHDLAMLKRKQLGPLLSSAHLLRIEPTLAQHGVLAIKRKWNTLIQQSPTGMAEVNYKEAFVRSLFDTMGVLVLGQTFEAMENDQDPRALWWPLSASVYQIAATTVPLLRIPPFSLLLWPLKRQSDQFADYISTRVVERQQRSLRAGNGKSQRCTDILQTLVDSDDTRTRGLHKISAECMFVLSTAVLTMSNQLAWAVHALVLHPEHYSRAVAEVRSRFGRDDVVTYAEGRLQLPYLEACIYECLRAASIARGQWPRIVPEGGVTLSSGHYLPAGTEVNMNHSGANLNRDVWQQPHEFDPGRFLGNDAAKRRLTAFSFGARPCMGRNLTMAEMTLMLGNLLKDFDFALPPDYVHLGPRVLDDRGCPRLMPALHFIITAQLFPSRDCRLVVSRRI